MYAVYVTVRGEDRVADPDVMLYGPFRSLEKAESVKLSLGEQALSAPATVDVKIVVMRLVRSGLPDLIQEWASGSR